MSKAISTKELVISILFWPAIFYFIYKRRKKQTPVIIEGAIREEVKLNLKDYQMTVQVRPDTQKEILFKELRSKAKSLVHENAEEAIKCMWQAKALMGKIPTLYPTSVYLEPAKLLHDAGYFEDALKEYHSLINDIEEIVEQQYFHCTPKEREGVSAFKYHEIYKALSKAYKKEKIIDEAEKYAKLSEDYEKKARQLQRANQKALEAKIKRRREKTGYKPVEK